MSKWLMKKVNQASAVVRRSPLFPAKTAYVGTAAGRQSPRGAVCAGVTWWGTLAVAALAVGCAAPAEPAEPDDGGDGDQVTPDVRVDWTERGVPVVEDAAAEEPDADAGAAPGVAPADAGAPVESDAAAGDELAPGEPQRVVTTTFLGTYCSRLGEWAWMWQGQLTVWSCGVRKEGWVREQGAGTVTVQWVSSCTDPQHCTVLDETEILDVVTTVSPSGAVTAVTVDGDRLERMSPDRCPTDYDAPECG